MRRVERISIECGYCAKSFAVRVSESSRKFCSLRCSARSHARTESETKFWAKVLVLGLDECWPWVASTTHNGYGSFSVIDPDTREHRLVRAHRYSWSIVNGPIPDDIMVLHSCDYRPCVNPNHLFLGTAKDNHDDMVEKGRAAWQTKSA